MDYFLPPTLGDHPLSIEIREAVAQMLINTGSCEQYELVAELFRSISDRLNEGDLPSDYMEGLYSNWIDGLRKIQSLHAPECSRGFSKEAHSLRSDL